MHVTHVLSPTSASVPKRRAVIGAAAVAALGGGVAAYLWRRPSVQGIEVHVGPRSLPPLRFATPSGAATGLVAWRGRTVLLNVWATWCTPCREEMPTLDRLQAALGGSGFEVLPVSVDSGGLAAVQAFFRNTGVKHLQPYLDTQHDTAQLAVKGIPLTLLVDAQGREVARKRGLAHWDAPRAGPDPLLLAHAGMNLIIMKLLPSSSLRNALAAAALATLSAASFASTDVTVSHAWARSTVPGQPVAAAYFDLRSERGATLTCLRSDAAATVQLHAMQRDGDIMRMRELPALVLPAGQTVHLAPGGTHPMLMQLKRPLRAGETLDLELLLQDGSGRREKVRVKVPVTDAPPQEHTQ